MKSTTLETEMKLSPLKKADMPEPLSFRKLIGPSFILLGMGLGSGELILWPYLSSNYGLGLMWAAVLGITFQFFLNMEIARYTLVTGESVFVGLTRKLGRISPVWFIFSTLLPWMWPGIIASSAKVLSSAFGVPYSPYLGIGLLVLIGIILSLGKVVYKTQEQFQKVLILLGIPFIFILTFLFAKPVDVTTLASGVIGKGNGFWFLPAGLPLAVFLGAFAYAGAGGNLNLAQSLYIKEKGYGMGKFAGRMTNLLFGKKEDLQLTGTTFEPNSENLKRFNAWWKSINLEHLTIFWATGALTMLVLSLLAYSTVFGKEGLETSINFVIQEGAVIGSKTIPFVGAAFLATAGFMLFGTQFAVFGTTSRIMSENLIVFDQERFPVKNLSRYFYGFLWLQIIAGSIIFLAGFTEPFALVVTGAVLNAFSMFIYSGLILWLNLTNLDKKVRPNIFRSFAISAACVFYGAFSIFTIVQNIF